MDDKDREEKPAATPAPPLSGEFLSGGTVSGLEKIRARLLPRPDKQKSPSEFPALERFLAPDR